VRERLNVGIDHFLNRSPKKCGSRRHRHRSPLRTGSDGTAGLRAIKAAGGLTFAQSRERQVRRDAAETPFAPASVDLF